MKKSSWKLPTFVLVLSMVMTILVLPSCRSLDLSNTHHSTLNSQHSTLTDTVVQRDSVVLHDSVIYRERTIHDTVYITKEVFRNQRLSTLDIQHSTKADTVRVVEYRDRVIEHPPEKYVPKFYKWCTIILWLVSFVLVGYKLMRYYLMRR